MTETRSPGTARAVKAAVPTAIHHAIRRVAQRTGSAVYLVGGPLRDILLGRAVTDIDIAVEGDPNRFGKALSRELGGEFKSFEQFGTGTVILRGSVVRGFRGSGGRIDVARTRTETYACSGALPLVRAADIRADLSRRDFTINAMAWAVVTNDECRMTKCAPKSVNRQSSIVNRNSPRLLDPFHGLDDLRRGLIRVLHEKSFDDDPTRIIRAVRFAVRFGFRIERGTRALLQRAIREKRLKALSGKRLMTELALVMQEKHPRKVLGALNRMGVFVSLSGARLSSDCQKDVARLPEPHLRLLYLISCLGARNWGLAVSEWPLTREQQAVRQSLIAYLGIRSRLMRARVPSRVYSLLAGHSRDALRIKAALEPKVIANKITAFLNRYSLVKPALSGQDLQRMGIRPGPVYTTLLDRLRAARLDGEVKTKQDEETLVKAAISKCGVQDELRTANR
jgi:tRNA nucleotidyltransferase (CCA-adding enzyme)